MDLLVSLPHLAAKRLAAALLALLAAALPAHAQRAPVNPPPGPPPVGPVPAAEQRVSFGRTGDRAAIDDYLAGLRHSREAVPQLDPKRIINDSNSFLKEREPEMTAEEYALYEKIVTMLGTNPDLAVRLLEAMMNDQQTPSPAFELILGNAYYAAGQNDKAETRFRSAVGRYATFLRAWNNLGVLYYSTSRFPQAVECFSKCVVLGDRDPVTFGLLGYSLARQGNNVAAELAYMQALAGDPGNQDWKEGLLGIYLHDREFGRAETLVRDLIKDHPTTARFWFSYANILLALNRKLEAASVLEAAAGTGVATADETALLGDLYAEQGMVPEAIATYERLLAQSVDLGQNRLLRYTRILTAAGRQEQAGQVLDQLAAKIPAEGRIALLEARSDLAMARKDWAGAHRELDALLKLAPLHGPALLRLGRVYTAEEDGGRAAFAFESAAQIPATSYEANLELANLELKNRHYTRAADHLRKALSIEKTPAVEDYLARVKTLIPTESS